MSAALSNYIQFFYARYPNPGLPAAFRNNGVFSKSESMTSAKLHTFAEELAAIQEADTARPAPVVEVGQGDTLSQMVSRFLRDRNGSCSVSDIYRGVDAVAKANGLANPDRIRIGQQFDFTVLIDSTSRPASASQEATRSVTLETLLLPLRGTVTSGFGLREDPFDHEPAFHKGVDIAAPTGTAVHAAASGEVVFSGWQRGYGRIIEIEHPDGLKTVYAHNSSNLVSVGQQVQQGEKIAKVGETGRATGPHLHFEIRKHNSPVDPASFLAELSLGKATQFASLHP